MCSSILVLFLIQISGALLGLFLIKDKNGVLATVLLLYGNSGIGAHMQSNLGYTICLRHLFRSSTETNLIFFSEKTMVLKYIGTNENLFFSYGRNIF